MHDLAHEFTSRKISPWGGIKYFYKTYLASGLKEQFRELPLPYPGSNRGFDPVDLLEGFMVSVVLGSRRLAHSGMIRTDEVIKEIFGWKKGMASASTFSRFFSKFDTSLNDEIFPQLMRYWYEQMEIELMTIDLDSTVVTRYGKQEYAAKGYNPAKPGRASHHPVMAFCEELKMVVNAWMRSGDSNSSTDVEDFLKETFTIVKPNRIGLLRGDCGFYNQFIMKQLESFARPVPYILRAKMTGKLLDEIVKLKGWYSCDDVQEGACYNEIQYKASTWDTERRMIIVRTKKKGEKKTSEYLFEEEKNRSMYDYKAYVTNTEHSAVMVHRLYNQRADCENRIKELKYDYGIDGFALHGFGAMEAAFRLIMLTHNVMALFRQKVMVSKSAKRLSTIRFQCIAIGSYLVKRGRNKRLKLSAEGKRRHFLEYFFSNLEVLHPPFQFSNA